jgi:hypothetical protein
MVMYWVILGRLSGHAQGREYRDDEIPAAEMKLSISLFLSLRSTHF